MIEAVIKRIGKNTTRKRGVFTRIYKQLAENLYCGERRLLGGAKKKVVVELFPYSSRAELKDIRTRLKGNIDVAEKLGNIAMESFYDEEGMNGSKKRAKEKFCYVVSESNDITVRELLEKSDLTLQEKGNLALQICKLVKDMHSHSQYHNNLSLDRIVIDEDFNLRVLTNHTGKTQPSIKEYIPDEIIQNTSRMDNWDIKQRYGLHSTDTFLTGLMVYEIFTGKKPAHVKDYRLVKERDKQRIEDEVFEDIVTDGLVKGRLEEKLDGYARMHEDKKGVMREQDEFYGMESELQHGGLRKARDEFFCRKNLADALAIILDKQSLNDYFGYEGEFNYKRILPTFADALNQEIVERVTRSAQKKKEKMQKNRKIPESERIKKIEKLERIIENIGKKRPVEFGYHKRRQNERKYCPDVDFLLGYLKEFDNPLYADYLKQKMGEAFGDRARHEPSALYEKIERLRAEKKRGKRRRAAKMSIAAAAALIALVAADKYIPQEYKDGAKRFTKPFAEFWENQGREAYKFIDRILPDFGDEEPAQMELARLDNPDSVYAVESDQNLVKVGFRFSKEDVKLDFPDANYIYAPGDTARLVVLDPEKLGPGKNKIDFSFTDGETTKESYTILHRKTEKSKARRRGERKRVSEPRPAGVIIKNAFIIRTRGKSLEKMVDNTIYEKNSEKYRSGWLCVLYKGNAYMFKKSRTTGRYYIPETKERAQEWENYGPGAKFLPCPRARELPSGALIFEYINRFTIGHALHDGQQVWSNYKYPYFYDKSEKRIDKLEIDMDTGIYYKDKFFGRGKRQYVKSGDMMAASREVLEKAVRQMDLPLR